MEPKVWRFVRIWWWNFEVFAFSKFWMSYFCPERSHPLRNRRLEGGADLNRPSRFQRSQNFWNLFVFGGTSCPNHHLARTAPLTGTTGERGKQFFIRGFLLFFFNFALILGWSPVRIESDIFWVVWVEKSAKNVPKSSSGDRDFGDFSRFSVTWIGFDHAESHRKIVKISRNWIWDHSDTG